MACRILVPQPGIKPMPPVVEAQSLNHSATREVPIQMVNQLCVCVCVCVCVCPVAQLCLTLCNPMDCSLPGSSVHEVFQARVLEWGVISSSPTSTFTLILCFQAFLLAVYLWPLLAREPLPWRQSSALTIFTQHLPPCLAHRGHSVHLCSGWTTAINS